MRTALAVLVAAALAAAVCGAIVRDDAIEYAANDEQLAFWSKTSHAGTPALITFPADVTVEQALPRVAHYLLGPNGGACRFVHASTGVLIADTRAAAGGHMRVRAFLDAATPEPPKGLLDVQPGSVSLHCDDARGFHSVKRAITRFVPPTPPPPSRPKWVGSSQYPNTNADLVGDTLTGLLHWAVEFVAVHWGEVHPFNVWPATASGRFDLDTGAPISVDTKGAAAFADADTTGAADTETRLALTADWGSGTEESDYVSQLLVKDYAPHWTVHIGDVYYLGAKEDFDSNVFGIPPAGVAHGVTWPHGSLGSFGLMGNHEMYSRGMAYFDHFLPTLGARNASGQLAGQAASYFSLENAYWRVICLDTGYNTYSIIFENNDNPQPAPVIEWLQNEVKIGDPTDTRGIIFFSHHQPLTAFDKEDKYPATPTQLQSLLPPNRTVLWLFGHEHRVSFYDLNAGIDGIDISLFARCVGNGGFPTSIAPIPGRAAATHLRAYDDRVYETYDGFWKAQIGYQGFQHLNFTGPTRTIDYKSLAVNGDGTPNPNASDLLVSEAWTTDAKGNVQLNSFNVVNPNITIVNP